LQKEQGIKSQPFPIMIKSLLAIAVLGLGALTSAHANLVTNGTFEATAVSSGTYVTLGSIPGWTGAPTIEIQNHIAGSPFAGNNFVELDSTANSAMYQDIPTTAGLTYTVSFAYSPRPGVAASSNGINFLWNNALVQTIAMSGLGLADTAWTVFSFNLLATGATSRIGFAATGTSDSLGGYLDNVTANGLSAGTAVIPEPATISLLGAGLLATALGARRRRHAR